MGRRKWLIITVVAVTVVLVVGIIGGVVYAQTTTPTPDSQGKTLLARVAAILGIEEQTLEDAFNQAKKEMSDEALGKKLDALVEQGKLTQEQADEYKEWWESRPDVPNITDGKGLRGFGDGFGGFRCFPGKMRLAPAPSATQ
jgi:hypothetical protein